MLPPFEAGPFAAFTERAVALQKVSEMACIGMGFLRRKAKRMVFFYAGS
jgi:hypothetical protein